MSRHATATREQVNTKDPVKKRTNRRLLDGAIRPIVEQLEQRQMLTAGPTVAEVAVHGSAWASGFDSFLNSSGLGTIGYDIPAGANQLLPLPWSNLNQVRVRFSEAVTVQQSDLSVYGVQSGSLGISGFAYDSGTYTATWTLSATLPTDRFTLALSDAITNGSGNHLDGEWLSSYPTGDGAAGGSLYMQFNVLPGDCNQDNATDLLDFQLVKDKLLTAPPNPNYSPYVDLNGSASINLLDFQIVKLYLLSSLPPVPSVQVSLPGGTSLVEGVPFDLDLPTTGPYGAPISAWQIDWGNQTDPITGNPASQSHSYDDGPDSHTISATAIELGQTYNTNSLNVTVANADPGVDDVTLVLGDGEGDSYEIGAHVADSGTLDTHTAQIHWDILNYESAISSPEVDPQTRRFNAGVIYPQDGTFDGQISVQDSDGGTGGYFFQIVVGNLPPAIGQLGYTGVADEGGVVNVSALLVDPGILDTHTVTIHWGDPSDDTIFNAPAQGGESGVAIGDEHIYRDNGIYTVTVTAVDDADEQSSDSVSFTVQVNNVPPTATIDGADSVDEGGTYGAYFGVIDPGDDTVSQYTVHWGDGHSDTYSASQWAALGGYLSHDYTDSDGPDSALIQVDLVDEDGEWLDAGSKLITIENVAPTVTILGAPTYGAEGSELSFTASVSDPAGDGDPISYLWTVIDTDELSFALPVDTEVDQPTFAFTPPDEGHYAVSVSVDDGDGGTHSASANVTVESVAPAGHWAFDEGAGTTTADSAESGTAIGTLFGPTWSSDSRTEGSLAFDGVNDCVALADSPRLGVTGPITLAAWIKPTATTGTRTIVSHGYSESGTTDFSLRIRDGRYEIANTTGSSVVGISAAVPSGDVNTWVFLAGTYDGTTLKLYRNGQLVASGARAIALPTVNTNWTIGANGRTTRAGFFSGLIDEVRVYRTALSAQAIGDLIGPSGVTKLAAVGTTSTSVLMMWTPPTDLAGNSLTLVRGQPSGTTSAPLAIPFTAPAYFDDGLTPGTAYTYLLELRDVAGRLLGVSATLSVTTPDTAPSDTTVPAPPTGLHNSTPTSDSVTIMWHKSTATDVTQYRLTRDGNVVSTLAADHDDYLVNDSGLSAGTQYMYTVVAADAAGNVSAATSIPITAAKLDATAPSAPTGLTMTSRTPSQVSLRWTASTDANGVVGYEIGEIGGGEIVTSSDPFCTLRAGGQALSLSVVAVDGAGNRSTAAPINIAALPASSGTDYAPDQIGPAAYESFFYDSLTAVLRFRAHQVSVDPPAARHWLDLPSPNGPGPADTVIADGQVVSLQWAGDLRFHDLNGNLRLDPGEMVWVDGAAGNGKFDSSDDTNHEPILTATPAHPGELNGLTGSPGLWYADVNHNGARNAGETILTDPRRIKGTDGSFAYRDANGNGLWDASEAIWADANGDGRYQASEALAYAAGGAPAPEALGKTGDIWYHDLDGTGGFGSGDFLFVDASTFRQDFAAFYRALESLLPAFARNDAGGFDANALPQVTWDLAGALGAVGLTPALATGTVTLTGTGTTLEGTGTRFTAEIPPGGRVLINGLWCSVSVSSDTLAYLSPVPPGLGAVTNASYSVLNWTRVPATAATANMPALARTPGRPDVASALFPKQFQELHDVLGLLSAPAGKVYYDAVTSGQYLGVAAQVIDTYEAIFGSTSTTLKGLKVAIRAGDMDPGSIRRDGDITTVRTLITEIVNAVRWRDETDPSYNGWKVPAGFNPIYVDVPNFFVPQPYFNHLPDLLPELKVGSTVVRSEGLWTAFHSPELGYQYAPVLLDEIQTVVDSVNINELWVDAGPLGRSDDEVYYKYHNPVPGDCTDRPWLCLPTYEQLLWTEPGQVYHDGIITSGFTAGDIYGDVPTYHAFDGRLSDTTVTDTLPGGANPCGGAALTQMNLGSDGAGYDVSGWAWGTSRALAQWTPGDLYAAIGRHLPPSDVTPSTPYTVLWALKDPELPGIYLKKEYTFHNFGVVARFYGPSRAYGVAPNPTTFTYTPTGSPPPPPALADAPADPISLTTRLDLLNTAPDGGTDDLVELPADVESFGTDTGVVTYDPSRQRPQVFLPLYTYRDGQLPIHAYLVQGGMESADGGSVASDLLKGADIAQDGIDLAYSLNTFVRPNLILNVGGNHIKRLEVVRPRGNAVVFDFPWNASTDAFETVGYPAGWDGRDANGQFVLRQGPSGSGVAYELMFPSGIVHQFGAGVPSPDGHARLTLTGIRSIDGRTATIPGIQPSFLGLPASGLGVESGGQSPRYNTTVNWAGGQLDSIRYSTWGDSPRTIVTRVGYNEGQITNLDKSDGVSGATIDELSYALSEDLNSLSHNNVTITRAGTSGAGGTVTYTTAIPGVSGSEIDRYVLNAYGLVSSYGVQLADQPMATTVYTYKTDAGRYNLNKAPQWASVARIDYPDGSWERFGYDADHGWVNQHLNQFHNSSADVDTGHVVEEISYLASLTGSMTVDDRMLAGNPTLVVTKIDGKEVSRQFTQYLGAGAIKVREAAVTGDTTIWTTPGYLETTVTPHTAARPADVAGPTGSVIYSEVPIDDGRRRYRVTTVRGPGGAMLSKTSQIINAFGYVDQAGSVDRTGVSTASSGRGGSPGDPRDAFGRPGAMLLNEVDTIRYEDWGWLGPAHYTDEQGFTTDYTYTPLGQVNTATALGISATYGYDAAGDPISTQQQATVNGESKTVGTGAAFDSLGRITSFTDAMDDTTAYAYATAGGVTTTTVTYPDDTTLVTETYIDGTPKSISGTSTYPVMYDSGITSAYHLSRQTDDPGYFGGGDRRDTAIAGGGGFWTKASQNGGQDWTTTYYNAFGHPYLVVQSGPNGNAVDLTGFDTAGRPVCEFAADGSSTLTQYNATTGDLSAVITDTDFSGGYTLGDSETLFSNTYIHQNGRNLQRSVTTTLGSGNSISLVDTDIASRYQRELDNGQLTETVRTGGESAGVPVVYTTTYPDLSQSTSVYVNELLDHVTTTGPKVDDQHAGPITGATNYGYDGLRRTTSMTNELGLTTTYELRDDGQVRSVTYDDGRTVVIPDASRDYKTGLPEAYTRADGGTVDQPVSDQGQVQSVSGAGVLPVKYDRDPLTGQLTGLSTFRSGSLTGTADTTQWHYNAVSGLLDSKTFADDSVMSFNYTGRQLHDVSYGGVTQTLGYDTAGRANAVSYTGGSQAASYQVQQFDQKNRPRVTTETVDGQTLTRATDYNGDDQLTAQTQPQLAGGATVSYEYYPATGVPADGVAKALHFVKLKRGDQTLVSYEYKYDSATKRLEKVLANGQTFKYGYKAGTDLIEHLTTAQPDAEAPGGQRDVAQATWSYDPDTGRLDSISSQRTSDAQTAYFEGYLYNANDQRTHTDVVRHVPGNQDAQSSYRDYTYDGLDQLHTASVSWPARQFTYAFDGAGNRTGTFGSVNTVDQYVNGTFAYDARGNQTDDGDFTYAYDPLDRLIEATAKDQSVRVTFGYDQDGRRTWKRTFQWNPLLNENQGDWEQTQELKLAYDGSNLIAELQVQPNGSEKLVRSYAWGLDQGGGVGGLLMITTYTAQGAIDHTYLPFYDGNGNVMGLADASSGSVVASYEYDPFGNVLSATGDAAALAANPFGFATKYRDAETGLLYFGLRYYSPVQGRFLTRDPIAESGGVNLYAYCQNDPVNKVDPLGLAGNDDFVRNHRDRVPPWEGAPVGTWGGKTRAEDEENYRKMFPSPIMQEAQREMRRAQRAYQAESELLASGYDPHMESYAAPKWENHVVGGARFVTGMVEATLGAMASEVGVGIPFVVDGWDTAQGGWSQMLSGEPTRTPVQRAGTAVASKLGASQPTADAVGDLSKNLLATYAGMRSFVSLFAPPSGELPLTPAPGGPASVRWESPEGTTKAELDTIPDGMRMQPLRVGRPLTPVGRYVAESGVTTPGGRAVTVHAAERMFEPNIYGPTGRVPMTPMEVDRILDSGNVIRKVDFVKRTITIQNTNLPGKPQVVVDMDTGERVITVINPKGK